MWLSQLRRGVFYLLEHVTSTDFFQIGDRKTKKKKKEKKEIDPIYHKFYVVYQR